MTFFGLTLGQIFGIVIAVSGAVFAFLHRQQLKKFLMEVVGELKKVSWPTQQELWDSSWVVITSSVLLGLFIASADFILSQLIKVVIK